jgi:hypothetical protein
VEFGNNFYLGLHNAVERFLHIGTEKLLKVYHSSESVHNTTVENTTHRSIQDFLSSYQLLQPAPSCNELIELLNVAPEIKRLITSFCHGKSVYKVAYGYDFQILATHVFHYILNHPNRDSLEAILTDEMNDAVDKCYHGRVARLINTINGYHDKVNIGIDQNAQISNIILLVRNKMYNQKIIDINIIKEKVKSELQERNYSPDVIDKWISYVDELD